MEIIQHLFGPTNRFPTGQRGAYAFWRTGANVLRPTRSAISHSGELTLVRGGVSFAEANVAASHHMILVSGDARFTFSGLRRHGAARVNVTSCVLWFHD